MDPRPTTPSGCGSTELSSVGPIPLELKCPTSSSLPFCPNPIQAASSPAARSLRRPRRSHSTVVVVSHIQLRFDPTALPTLGNRSPLSATLELSPSSASSRSSSQHTTAEIRPVAIGPGAAVVSWYQCC
eukprot:RCo048707